MNSIIRSKLADVNKRKKVMTKIASLFAQRASRVVFEVDGVRFSAAAATNVAFDVEAADDQIAFQRPGGVSVEYYDLTDIAVIKRLRTKKYLIRIKRGADDAQATV